MQVKDRSLESQIKVVHHMIRELSNISLMHELSITDTFMAMAIIARSLSDSVEAEKWTGDESFVCIAEEMLGDKETKTFC